MSRRIIILLIMLIVGTSVFGQFTSKDNYTGVWTDNNSWVGGTAPGTNLSTNVTIYGYITLSGSLTFGGASGDLNVVDTLVIEGDLILGNNNNLSIGNGGILIVQGSVTAANKVDIAGNGYFIVFGDFTKTGSAGQGSFTSDDSPSNVFIGGTIDVPGGWADGPGDVFNCDGADDYDGTGCNYGDFDDILEDPINDFVGGTCSSKPVIDTQPTNQVSCVGGSATFSVSSSSVGITYKWQKMASGDITWSNILDDATYSGALTSDIQVNSITSGMDGDMFRCIVRYTDGCSTPSDAATLTVNAAPAIALTSDAATENQTVCINTPISNITYSSTGSTGANFTGLPLGVTGEWNSGNITIFGTPSEAGTFNYTIDLIASCGSASGSGTIVVNQPNVASILGNITTCTSNIDYYEVTENVNWTYSWTIEDGVGTIQAGANTFQIEVLWKTNEELFVGPTVNDTSTTKIISCQVTDSSGCIKVVELSVTIHRVPETGPQYHIPNTFGN